MTAELLKKNKARIREGWGLVVELIQFWACSSQEE